ncbi:hypothetical protein BDF21DRAFT_409747 [Thamnidium elegans]|nr:hypothetical protein BDF21DRAFT_409747 [Thamnidium elegans]
MLEPVHDFSLYLHGVGTLLDDRVHVFPSWFSKMEILDIRHTEYRGSLLFVEEEKATSESSQVVTSRSRSSTNSDKQYWSSNTIATIVTCYEDEIKHANPSPSSSSSSSSSSLLSPVSKREGKLRRSFDSYCSFDHPTSSKSDPTNCKSCTGKLNQEHRMFALKKTRDDTECATFLSVLKSAIRGLHLTAGEREPLLCNKQDAATHIRHHGYFMGFSRATVITTSCVFTSFLVSYLLYIFILKIK